MENYILLKESKELQELSKQLGFTRTLFLDKDFVLIKAISKKDLLKKINQAKRKITIFKAESEELLRFALEKSPVNIVYGMETINYKDSVHFVRGGLDQIMCRIAKDKGKTIAFSFSELLKSRNRGQLIARIKLNIKLCKMYKVKTVFTNFSSKKMEMRSAKDLKSFWTFLNKN